MVGRTAWTNLGQEDRLRLVAKADLDLNTWQASAVSRRPWRDIPDRIRQAIREAAHG